MMEIIQIIISIALPLMIFYLGVLDRKLNHMQAKLEKSITREEASKLVELELKSVANEQSNLKEDLVRIESKLDKLLERDYRK